MVHMNAKVASSKTEIQVVGCVQGLGSGCLATLRRPAIRLPALMQNKKGIEEPAESPSEVDIEGLINQQV